MVEVIGLRGILCAQLNINEAHHPSRFCRLMPFELGPRFSILQSGQ